MELEQFLRTVITAEAGLFCLALRSFTSGNQWWEEWFEWPEDIDKIIERTLEQGLENDVYFSSYLFGDRTSKKSAVLQSRTIQADLDNADIKNLPLQPSVLIESSPNRYQAYWLLKEELDLETHELLSRKLTYSIPLCDRSGWPLGRKLRLPYTFNHKYLDGPQFVSIKESSLKVYESKDIELLPEPDKILIDSYDFDWVDNPKLLDQGPQQLLESIKEKLPVKVYAQYNFPQKDRSAALWAFMCACFRCGLSRETVYHLSYHNQNNKFVGLRYNRERELAKDVIRAEQTVRTVGYDIREIVLEARKVTGNIVEKRQQILRIVLEYMNKVGVFIRTQDDMCWYIRNDLGRPIAITPRSEYLQMIMDAQFGLNSTEIDQSYVVAGLVSYARSLPSYGKSGSLSYFDIDQHKMYIHTGKATVYGITKDSCDKITDGANNIVFPWPVNVEPFIADFSNPVQSWSDELFGNYLNNIVNLPKEEAIVLLETWFMFLLFRNSAVSRPVLALFGQPGSGKSTLFRRMYALLYGFGRSLSSVTTSDDFDHSVSVDPLVVLDNVDTWERWLPDRLALSASTSDITKRKLYTDVDTVIIKRQALIGITAHNPRFGREDVADRLILLMLERLSRFIPEGDIISGVLKKRNQIWARIIIDIQKILATPQPHESEVPQFRVEDFARVGYWIATGLGKADLFVKALKNAKTGQRTFSLEEDSLLTSTVYKLVQRQSEPKWKTVSQIWSELELVCDDAPTFCKMYRNSVYLGRKLWALQEALREVINIEWRNDNAQGARTWKLSLKGSNNGRVTGEAGLS